MVFFNDRCASVDGDSSDDEQALQDIGVAVPSSSSTCCSSSSQGHRQVVVDLPRVPSGLDISVSHTVTQLPPDVDTHHLSAPIRGVGSLCSLFDLTSCSGCTSTYIQGRELGGKSSMIALQVPASSLPPPLSAESAIADSYQIRTSRAFLPHLQGNEQRLLDAGPSTRESMPCAPCGMPQVENAMASGGVETSNSEHGSSQRPSNQRSVLQRLTEVLDGRICEVTILQPAERDSMILQFLQALDVQVVGACRTDERLRPMLRWNMSCTGSDFRLLEHLSQHFKARELGLLARCLCAPLVTIRVGKIERQGRFLCPTGVRGFLSLSMLPSSEMQLSFVGDDGTIERIAAMTAVHDEACIHVESIPADSSGRSFVLKLPGGVHVYFWQSEKSKAAGDGLIYEMRDILTRRPTLSKLTGVHESRLDSFVSRIHGLLSTAASSEFPGFVQSPSNSYVSGAPASATETGFPSLLPSISSRQSQRLFGSRSVARAANTQPCAHGRGHGISQGSLSARTSGFKEGCSRGMPSSRLNSTSRERHRKRIDSSSLPSSASLSTIDWTSNAHSTISDAGSCPNELRAFCSVDLESAQVISSTKTSILHASTEQNASIPHATSVSMNEPFLPKQLFSIPLAPSSLPVSLPSLIGGHSYNQNALLPPTATHLMTNSSMLAPIFCPCPLKSSSLHCAVTPPFFPAANEICEVPSSSSLFSIKPSSPFFSQTTISLDRVSISPIPLPVSSLVNIPTPLQTSSLPPFFSDPIVHIPVVDFQAGNQSFLVSSSPSISTIGSPTVLPGFLSSIISHGERLTNEHDSSIHNFQNLGDVSFVLDDHVREASNLPPFLVEQRFRALSSGYREDHKDENKDQGAKSSWLGRLDGSRCSIFDALPQYSCPLLGMVPTIITSGSLSCVLNIHQERGKNAAAWISGSQSLYCRNCEPAGSVSLPQARSTGGDIFMDRIVSLDVDDAEPPSQNSENKDGDQKHTEASEDKDASDS